MINLNENFIEYIKIKQYYDLKKEVNIKNSDNLSPVNVVPLLNLITEEQINFIKPHENPKINYYLNNVLNRKKQKYNYEYAMWPLGWLCPNDNNSNEIIEAILRIMNPNDFIKNDLKFILEKLTNNVYKYSNFSNGIIMSQKFPEINEQEYVVFDNGEHIIDLNDCNRFFQLIKEDVDLNNIVNIVTRKFKGNILFVSGNCCVEFTPIDVISKYVSKTYFKGTMVSFRF